MTAADAVRPAREHSLPVFVVAASAFSLPYIASKVVHALQARLGVHGGPIVTDTNTAAFGSPGEIAAAQWGNAGIGVVIALVTVLPLAAWTRRWRRPIAAIPLACIGVSLLALGIVMLVRAIALGLGGVLFAVYLLIWSAMECVAAARVARLAGRTKARDPAIPES